MEALARAWPAGGWNAARVLRYALVLALLAGLLHPGRPEDLLVAMDAAAPRSLLP